MWLIWFYGSRAKSNAGHIWICSHFSYSFLKLINSNAERDQRVENAYGKQGLESGSLKGRYVLHNIRDMGLIPGPEDPTCRGATKPVRHNYWACTLQPASHNYWARVPQLLKPACLEPVFRNKRSHCNEKPAHRNRNKEKPPLSATRESPHAATKTQHSQK